MRTLIKRVALPNRMHAEVHNVSHLGGPCCVHRLSSAAAKARELLAGMHQPGGIVACPPCIAEAAEYARHNGTPIATEN